MNRVLSYPLTEIIEGKTIVLVPDIETLQKSTSNFTLTDAPVFYNERMEINRDFALALIRVYLARNANYIQNPIFCEPMAGSGIRAIRVANEIDTLEEVIINDRNPEAVNLIQKNIQILKLDEKVTILDKDANELMLQFSAEGKKIDIIDLDPFGTPAPFLDSIAQAIKGNGLLAITSTDMATKCGVYPKACIRKYASQPIHTWIGHEMAVRILLGFTASTIARHGKAIKPIFVHSTEHFIRCYVFVEKGITKAKKIMEEIGFVAHCMHCYSIEFSKGLINQLPVECPSCKKKRLLGGPVWLGKLYQKDYVKSLQDHLENNKEYYGTQKKILRMLELISDEVRAENSSEKTAFYYDIHEITDKLNIPSPKSSRVIEELEKKNFIATRTHFKLTAIKTDAPIKEIISAIEQANKDN